MKKITLYIPNDKFVLKDLIQDNFFKKMNNKKLFKGIVYKQRSTKLSLSNFLEKKLFLTKYRYFFWSIAERLARLELEKKNYGFGITSQTLVLSNIEVKFSNLIFNLGLSKLVIFFIKKYLIFTMKKYSIKGDHLIIFGSSKDLHYFDLVYLAKKLKKKVLLITNNWDNATSKPFLIFPDAMGCWGSQTKKIASKIHKIPMIYISGTPRFNKFQNIKIKNNFKNNNKKILFVGSRFYMYEIEVLKIISNVISKNFNNNFTILYRPHPYTMVKNFDFINNIKNVKFEKSWKNFSSINKENNLKLLKSTDGLISVMVSTMMLEALHFYMPVLALSTNFKNQGIYDWELNHKNLLHLRCTFNKNFILNSCSTINLEKKCKVFFKNILDKNYKKKNSMQIYKFLNDIISKSRYYETIQDFTKN